jgi:hypothetical protein
MNYFLSRFFGWVPLGVGITLTIGLVYVSVQQTYRQGANDPQIQIVQEVARDLAAGQDPKALDAGTKLDLKDLTSPFVIVYDKDGKLVASTVTLDGNPPIVPVGALHETDAGQQNRITWEPAEGVREAIVIAHYKTSDDAQEGYIVAGRSLAEVESRVSDFTKKLAIGLAVTLVTTLIASVLVGKLQSGLKVGQKKNPA